MAIRVGINGFGRIGRQTFRAIRERYPHSLEVVAINDLFDAETNARMLKYDTNYGVYPGTIEVDGNTIWVDNLPVASLSERDPARLPWGELGVRIVFEATGIFRRASQAVIHLENGAKKVIITAPAREEDITIVMGVNQEQYDPEQHHIISNASCTTNCLAPLAKVLLEKFGIVRGLMTTVHAYTNDQRILDLAHKDPRRARAAAQNIIPTTTGAARAVALVLPELAGKFDGVSLRVPTPTVSIVDLVVELEQITTAEEINRAFREASKNGLRGILAVSDDLLVSTDFRGDSHSSIIDSPSTEIMDAPGKGKLRRGSMAKIMSWYDNEWGYACRLADLAHYIVEREL
jgi:glyceraldehyde 3-phosphate dehydrogenase